MTHRNRSGRAFGLWALTLLALGLAACGGSEPAASVPPPAPLPAPPPFVPQAVEVALGSSGDTLTLMTAQAGGFTLHGEAFASGSHVTAQANGSTYTLTLDGTTWSAAYKTPAPISLALGSSGATISIQRLEDGSFQARGSAIANGTVVTADNGNSYTIVIRDDGAFAAEFVQPPALSIALGSSGSTVQARINEDRTFSALLDGQWTLVTADTRLTAANGNVYGVQFADGLPRPVYAGHSQQVMLGALGGTLTLTRAEDMSWWLGETEVQHGHVHRAANGNDYVLSLNAEGHWSAMYRKVVVNVTLGTQGSIGLERAEDMSWWHGSEAVGVGTPVTSANGNTYTLWYADGAWTARFEAQERMIAGTSLTAYTREADDRYDVGGATLPASGTGDITVDGAMYHVWMQGGGLAGARFDKAIDNETRYVDRTKTDTNKGIAFPALSAEDAKMAGNQARTHLLVTGDADTGKGMFSIGDLLGSGTASDRGKRFVDEAVKKIEKVRDDVAALIDLGTKPTGLDGILDGQWTKLEQALDKIFGTDSDHETEASRTSAVRQDAPREEDILGDINDILDALSSADKFVAATAADGNGAFATAAGGHGVLGAGAARDAFNRVTWSAMATLGMTGSTRYGTALRKASGTAKDKPSTSEYGAFSYATMQETQRTADAAKVSLTGIASYSGGTRAVSGSGKHYAGQMDLQVRFNANTVSGVVSGLTDAVGKPWMHNFAPVDKIVLGDATLRRNAKWKQPAADNTAIVFYTAESGLLRPVEGIRDTFEGVLLGRDDAAGSEANGVWSVGDPTGTTYLAGGFGVRHVANVARPVPAQDDGSAAGAKLFTTTTTSVTSASASIADGMLEVKARKYGWAGRDGATAPTYQALTDDKGTAAEGDDTNILITAKFDLAALAAASGAASTVNGPKHIDTAIAVLTMQREQLVILKGLGERTANTKTAEAAAWQKVVDAVQYNVFNGLLPVKLAGDYATSTTLQADALDLIDRVLDALSSRSKLEAALDPDGPGIFDHYWIDSDTDGVVDAGETHDFRYYDSAQRRYEVVDDNDPTDTATMAGRTAGQIIGEREHRVIAALGTTEFTRFGIWRRESHRSARRNGAGQVLRTHGGPGRFAYSPLDPTDAGTPTNPGFPKGGRASYVGETVAMQGTTKLTGTVRVDVKWNTLTSTSTGLTSDGNTINQAGFMDLTISGLASAAGDPLSHGGSTTQGSESPGNEIADIVLITGIGIPRATGSNRLGQMIVAHPSLPDLDGTVRYGEIGDPTAFENFRIRFSDAGTADNTDDPSSAGIKALFVGQGVDGPLGVIGTWQLRHTAIGRVSPDGSTVQDLGVRIYGAFGAEAP